MILLAIPFGLLIGMSVGSVGGGGAILALPVLVYVLGKPVNPASTASLIVVALAASVGAGSLARGGHVHLRLALLFSAPALRGGAPLPERPGWQGPDRRARRRRAHRLLRRRRRLRDRPRPHAVVRDELPPRRRDLAHDHHPHRPRRLREPHRPGHQPRHPVTAALAGSTMVGALIGSLVGERLPQQALGRGFAIVVAAVAVFLLVDTALFNGPPGSRNAARPAARDSHTPPRCACSTRSERTRIWPRCDLL